MAVKAPGDPYIRWRNLLLVILWGISLHLAYRAQRYLPGETESGVQVKLQAVEGEEKVQTPARSQLLKELVHSTTGLAALCKQKEWVPQRWFMCDDIEGGAGNVQNALLHCVRYAIEAGASLILPPQTTEILYDDSFEQGGTPMRNFGGEDFLFQADYFQTSLQEACPAMKIVNTVTDVSGYSTAWVPQPFQPRDLSRLSSGQPSDSEDLLNRRTATFRKDFDLVMGSHGLTIFRLAWPVYFEWPVLTDSDEFRNSFGGILRPRKDVQQLANQVLEKLTEGFYGIDLSYDEGTPGTAKETLPIMIASHMRQVQASAMRVVYVAGTQDEILLFRNFALNFAVVVEDKESLLEGGALTLLRGFSGNQKSLLDFVVLLRASQFSGVGASSFSQAIAVQRHQHSRSRGLFQSAGDEITSLFNGRQYSFFSETSW